MVRAAGSWSDTFEGADALLDELVAELNSRYLTGPLAALASNIETRSPSGNCTHEDDPHDAPKAMAEAALARVTTGESDAA